MTRLKEVYNTTIAPALMEKFKYKSVMQVPKILKITLNMGVGEAVNDKKVMNFAVDDMMRISGQKPIVTLAKKSIAGFKIRDGWPIGCKVISITLPRVRDFRGLNPRSFDAQGNYSLGLHEQIVFSEINFDNIDGIRGLDICITTSAKTKEEGRALLEAFNFPLKDRT